MLLIQKLENFDAYSEDCFCYFWVQPSLVPYGLFLCSRNVQLIVFVSIMHYYDRVLIFLVGFSLSVLRGSSQGRLVA